MKVARFTWMFFYIWLSLVLMQSVSVDGNCKQIVRYINHYTGLQSRIRPNVEGEWTSSRCEVRPGPKFVTRYFNILRNSTWQARFHHYSDYQCTKPSFTLLFKGFYKMGNKASILIAGSTETNFNYSSITIHPHTAEVERSILNVAKRSCQNTLTNIKTDPGIGVYSAQLQVFNKKNCRTSFGISRYELSIVKKVTRRGKGSEYDVLYFGEVQTGRSRRKYNPTSYQLPLKRHNARNCTVCRTIRGSTAVHPPTFPKIRPRPVLLDDAWGSWTCETRPGGSFLTRYMVFHYKRRHWEGYFNYFKDPYCKKLMFTLYGKGVFSGGSRSTKVKGGEDYVFTLTEAALTPNDRATTRALNSVSRNNECGKDGEWVTGVPMDISQSKGCRMYGISLPHTEYDLLKMDFNENEDRELYVGQRPTSNKSPTSPSSRPTSYQIPMLRCSSFNMNFIPPTPEPTKKPSTRYPKPPVINPILTVPTLKRDGEKTTPKRKGKTSKGTKGSGVQGVEMAESVSNDARSLKSSLFSFIALMLMVKML